jgi:hypothetical protein
MNQFMQQPFSVPQMQSSFLQVGWNPTGHENMTSTPNAMPQIMNSMYHNQGYSNNNMGMPMQPQVAPTLAELEAFVQTRRQKEEAEK